MDRNFFRYAGVLLMTATTGCAMCDNSQDGTFGAYGGRWQRTDPYCGRVASVIDPAGVNMAGSSGVESPEQKQSDDDGESVLRLKVVDPLDGETTDEFRLDMTPVDEAQDEPVQSMIDDEPVSNEAERGADAAPSGRAIDELPDFLKDLGIESQPSPSAATDIEEMPPVDIGRDLPPLRTDAER